MGTDLVFEMLIDCYDDTTDKNNKNWYFRHIEKCCEGVWIDDDVAEEICKEEGVSKARGLYKKLKGETITKARIGNDGEFYTKLYHTLLYYWFLEEIERGEHYKDELECMVKMTELIEIVKDKYENCEEFRNKLNDLLKKFED